MEVSQNSLEAFFPIVPMQDHYDHLVPASGALW